MSVEREAEFAQLMQRVREGSDDAIEQLLQRYNKHIYRAIRRRLHRSLRPRFDSDDFVQAVWASFFANVSVVSKFDRPQPLIAFLARVASNKVIDECRRRFKSQKDNINSETPIKRSHLTDLSTDDPTASEIAVANEEWTELVKGEPQRNQEILRLRSVGMTSAEIAEQLDVSPSTVRRAIQKLAKRHA